MRPQPEIIHLGAQEWSVRPLTLAQVQAIEPILMATQGIAGQDQRGNVAAAIAIVSIALARDHASAVEGLMEIEATAPEIATAMTKVLKLGGFIDARAEGQECLGEAGAGAIPPPVNPSA
jgi:hypothetical protein